MDINSKLNKSSEQHQDTKIMRGRNQTFQEDGITNYQDRLKLNNHVGLSNCDQRYELRPNAHNKGSVQPELLSNHQGKCLEGKMSRNQEMAKYMSNLPDYLQHQGRVNFQGNILNIGVLDWSRFEYWKDAKQNSFDTAGKTASSSRGKSIVNTISSGLCSNASGHPNKLHSSASNASGFIDMGGSNCLILIQDCETAPVRKWDRQNEITLSSKSDRYFIDEMIGKEKQKDRYQELNPERRISLSSWRGQELNPERGISLSSWRDLGVLHDLGTIMNSQESRVERKVRESQEFGTNRKQEGSSSSENEPNAEGGRSNWKREELQDSKASLDYQHSALEPRNIELLYPKNSHHRKFSEVPQCPNLGTTAGKDLIGGDLLNRQSINSEKICYISNKSHSEKVHYEIAKLSRRHTRVDADTECNVQSRLKARKNDTPDVSRKSPQSSEKPEKLPQHKPAEKHKLNLNAEKLYSGEDKAEEKHRLHTMAASPKLSETLKTLSYLDTAELTANRSRNPSSNRQFSLPHLHRRFSFREGSGVPQLSSSYVSFRYGPVRSVSSASLDTTMAEKENDNNRGKHSFFRRLLDPLGRSNGADTSQSRETGQPLEGGFYKNFVPGRPDKKEKDKESEVQATIMLTIKNSIPLYKLLVDSDSNIFAATTKNFSEPGNDDSSGQNYTFYSINKIKKKSGSWLTQGSKEKSNKYAYNIVGHMKVSSNYTSGLDENKTSSNYMVVESVLLDVENRQTDKELPESFTDKELAAVVVRIPSEVLSFSKKTSVEDKDSLTKIHAHCFFGDECLLECRRIGVYDNITVILPGGVHSLPLEGKPSTLTNRWKSGGLCDCGGWDVGCHIHVLTNKKKSCVVHETSRSCSVPDHMELFFQPINGHERPVFSLVHLENGIYSVRFSTQISVLQSFFISVVILSNWQLSRVSDFSKLAEAVLLEPDLSDFNQQKKPIAETIQGHGKYVSSPYSPIGRA